MFPAGRRRLILDLVLRDGAMSLKQLAAAADTSEVTVRRDLRQLEAEGLLVRRRGGALAPASDLERAEPREPTFSEKSHVASAHKAAIAARAAELIDEGDAVILGAGTTTAALARELVDRADLTVVTNSLLVAQILAGSAGVDVTVTGGSLRGSTFALVGPAAERGVADLHARRVFLSGNGLTAARGLSTPNVVVASMDRALVAAARELVVLADHTKIGVDAMVQTATPERISTVVTDWEASATEVAALRDAGVVTVVTDARMVARNP